MCSMSCSIWITEEVVLAADLLQVVVWLTPAGTLDDGGVKQPAYLNFEVSLLGPPAGNEMKVGPLNKTVPEMAFEKHLQQRPLC